MKITVRQNLLKRGSLQMTKMLLVANHNVTNVNSLFYPTNVKPIPNARVRHTLLKLELAIS